MSYALVMVEDVRAGLKLLSSRDFEAAESVIDRFELLRERPAELSTIGPMGAGTLIYRFEADSVYGLGHYHFIARFEYILWERQRAIAVEQLAWVLVEPRRGT